MPPPAMRLAWLRSLEAHTYLVELMDQELRRDCGVPLPWYDVMVKLYRAPDQRLRMADLADKVLVSRSWLTRRVAQLEAAGLVERIGSDGDGRGVVAQLTDHGRETFKQMDRSHGASIRRHFSSFLTAEEADVVAAVFERIAEAARTELTS